MRSLGVGWDGRIAARAVSGYSAPQYGSPDAGRGRQRQTQCRAVPRGIHVNPDLGCPQCGRDLYRHGSYPWKISPERPWKLECPSCGEVWPRNDFATFHASGLGRGGVFRRDLADESLLFNREHPDPGDPLRGYAVDDGMGWFDGNGRRWWFIAFYGHYGVWTWLPDAASDLATAYQRTGEARYAHKAFVILDRIADVYPAMDLCNSHGGPGKGRVWGCIWETGLAEKLARAWDMVRDRVEADAELTTFLHAKAALWKLANDKSTAASRETRA